MISMDEVLNNFSKADLIGQGFEALVYDIGNSKLLKYYKPSDHQDFLTLSAIEKKSIDKRHKELETKLREFPRGLPKNVISPQQLYYITSGSKFVGYTMEYIQNAKVLYHFVNKKYKKDNNITTKSLFTIIKNMHETLKEIHKENVVIGDFNDLNVLVSTDGKAYFIDSDSYQFKNYICTLFNIKFADPLLLSTNSSNVNMNSYHSEVSDWYSFVTLCVELLLSLHPYDGVYKSKTNKILSFREKLDSRYSIFSKEIIYPKYGVPLEFLSDELKEYFTKTFNEDRRTEFPITLLDEKTIYICKNCGFETMQKICSLCKTTIKNTSLQNVTYVQSAGNYELTTLFTALENTEIKDVFKKTKETVTILFSKNYEDTEVNSFYRNDFSNFLHPLYSKNEDKKVFVHDNYTVVGQKNNLSIFDHLLSKAQEFKVDRTLLDRNIPSVCSNNSNIFFVKGGKLIKLEKTKSILSKLTNTLFTEKIIGDVVANSTEIWVGEKFGFGIFNKEFISGAFTFSTEKVGIREISFPFSLTTKIYDIQCYFASDYCWVFYKFKEGNNTFIGTLIISEDGNIFVLDKIQDINNNIEWLQNLKNKCILNNILLSNTDSGIIGTTFDLKTQEVKTKNFTGRKILQIPSDYKLLPMSGKLLMYSEKEIKLLTIK